MTERDSAPGAAAFRCKREVRAVESYRTAAECIGRVTPGMALFALTRGQFSMIDVVLRAKQRVHKGALQLSFTAFCPDAAAPLCLAPLDDGYWVHFDAFWHWFFEDVGYTRKVQLFRCASPVSRLAHATGSMAASEDDLRRGWLDRDPPNWRVRYAYRGSARRAYDVYARRVGLPVSHMDTADGQ